MTNQVIVKANSLIQASHRLSLNEQRIVLSAITQVRRDVSVATEDWYTVTAADLADAAGINQKKACQYLESAVESLWQREVVVRSGPNGDPSTPKGETVMKCRWIQAIEYKSGEGYVKMMFSAPIVPYLSDLKEQFTKYELRYVAPMHSRFGPRLYEILMQWIGSGSKTISVDDLKSLWDVSGYDRIDNLKRRVIKPAVNDVNKFSDIAVSFKDIKKGRKVTHIQFDFARRSRDSKRVSNRESVNTSNTGSNGSSSSTVSDARKTDGPSPVSQATTDWFNKLKEVDRSTKRDFAVTLGKPNANK